MTQIMWGILILGLAVLAVELIIIGIYESVNQKK